MRGSLEVPVTVGFRKAEKPYTFYVERGGEGVADLAAVHHYRRGAGG